jgi:hypothetical protein
METGRACLRKLAGGGGLLPAANLKYFLPSASRVSGHTRLRQLGKSDSLPNPSLILHTLLHRMLQPCHCPCSVHLLGHKHPVNRRMSTSNAQTCTPSCSWGSSILCQCNRTTPSALSSSVGPLHCPPANSSSPLLHCSSPGSFHPFPAGMCPLFITLQRSLVHSGR